MKYPHWALVTVLLATCFPLGLGGQQAGPALTPMAAPPILADPTQSLKYSSQYGPRFIDGLYEFHFGVDYAYPFGTPYYAVESGTISSVGLDVANDWVMSIDGDAGHHFTYIHMFDNSWMTVDADSLPTDATGHLVLAQACLNDGSDHPISDGVSDESCANPSDLVTLEATLCATAVDQSDGNLAVVFWTDYDRNLANRVLTPCRGDVIGQQQSTAYVAQGDLIGLVGHSGRAASHGAHLHLQVHSGQESPLAYVEHDSPANGTAPTYAVTICKGLCAALNTLQPPPVSNLLNPAQDSPLTIVAEVNSSIHGHDLDAAGIFMFSAAGPNPSTVGCQGTGGVIAACFAYGGKPGTTRTVFPLAPSRDPRSEPLSAALQQGTFPKTAGIIDFLAPSCCVTAPIDLTSISPGSYLISVSTVDVLGDVPQQTSVAVTVPPKLTVTVVGPGSVSSTPSGLNSGINNCGQGQMCFDWFDTTLSSTVALAAIPEPNSIFTGWTGNCAGTATFIPIVLAQNKSCSATFQACPTTLLTNFGPGVSYQNSTATGWATGGTSDSSNAVSFAYPSATPATLQAFQFAAEWFNGSNILNVGFWGGSSDLNSATLLESFAFTASAFRVPQIFDAISILHPLLVPGNTYFVTLSVPGAPTTDWGWQWNSQGQNGFLARFGTGSWFAEAAVTPAFDVCF